MHQCRALLDSGAMSNFVTNDLCEKLNLNLQRAHYAVTGVGKAMSNIQFTTNLKLSSSDNSFSQSIECLVLSQITPNLPVVSFNRKILEIPENLALADPNFNKSAPIDLLLGSSTCWEFLCTAKVQLGDSKIFLHETKLGWIIAGGMHDRNQTFNTVQCFSAYADINTVDNNLVNFWNIEELNVKNSFSESEQFGETHFKNTYRHDQYGRFIKLWEVKLAWDDPILQSLLHDWLTVREGLKFLDTIKIPRQVTVPNCSYLELHGFADSSEV
ncbi:Pao retrotransposon peptidase [Popillia japonica]|uniref:Pao retrotransposon peptidase n=1 Tax=Popillia japonica TaxID=7064 RepID=A0AAW1JF21_POPJA